MLEDLALHSIAEEQTRELVRRLRNVLEDVRADRRAAQADIQRLRNESNRLKGEQGQPARKPHTPPPPPKDLSAAQARRTPTAWSKGRQPDRIPIDREHVVAVALADLPPDAGCKGYADVVGQDGLFRTDKVRCRTETLSSPSPPTPSVAALPQGSRGPCGPGIKSVALVWYFGAQMSAPKVAERLRSVGVPIADGQVSHLLIQGQAPFHAAQAARSQAGLARSPWQHLEDTSTRVNGQHGSCPIVCHPLSTASCTTAAKDRLTLIDGLTTHRPRRLLVHAEALGFMEACGVSVVRRQQGEHLPSGTIGEEATMQALLETSRPGWGPQPRQWIVDATAVAASHAEVECPVVRLWVGDDAPQCPVVTEELALGWVHAGRHEKTLLPSIPYHQGLLEAVVPRFWTSDDPWLAYREQPTPEEATRLPEEFATRCATGTGSQALDERMATTRAKQRCLLMVLAHPDIPLHNTPAELGARARGRKRDVSVGPRTPEGARAWDTFMTRAATATTLGVSFYHYMQDRISGTSQRPSLADLLGERATMLHLGASWDTS